MKRKIEENFSFLEHLIAVKLESITYTRFHLFSRLSLLPFEYHRYLRCFISSWQQFHFLQFNFKISLLPVLSFSFIVILLTARHLISVRFRFESLPHRR